MPACGFSWGCRRRGSLQDLDARPLGSGLRLLGCTVVRMHAGRDHQPACGVSPSLPEAGRRPLFLALPAAFSTGGVFWRV